MVKILQRYSTKINLKIVLNISNGKFPVLCKKVERDDSQILLKFNKFKINVGTLSQKDRLFKFNISNSKWGEKGDSKAEISDAIVRSILAGSVLFGFAGHDSLRPQIQITDILSSSYWLGF